MRTVASILGILCLACGLHAPQTLTWLIQADCASNVAASQAPTIGCPMTDPGCCVISCCCSVTPVPDPAEPTPTGVVVESLRIDWVPRESRVQWSPATEPPRDEAYAELADREVPSASARRAVLAVWQT